MEAYHIITAHQWFPKGQHNVAQVKIKETSPHYQQDYREQKQHFVGQEPSLSQEVWAEALYLHFEQYQLDYVSPDIWIICAQKKVILENGKS